jgi:catechol 2,3-dioxygenase
MATLPLDLDDVISELGADPLSAVGSAGDDPGLAAGTTIGHVHLQVADIDAAERFYAGVLGFEVMVRGLPGALFVAAGGYHHHLGLNTWHSRGAQAPADGAAGLRWYQLRLGNDQGLQEVLRRVADAGLQSAPLGEGTLVRDPSGNAVVLGA